MKIALSFGGGRQTMACLVLIAEGQLPRPDAIIMADPGGEQPATYQYLREWADPYADSHGLAIVRLDARWREASYQATLEQYCFDHHMLPGTYVRWCTEHYKVRVLKHYREQVLGASPTTPVESWIGISADEPGRIRPSGDPSEVKRYPLFERGIDVEACKRIVAAAGLPVPPKSGCDFCPFMRRGQFQQLKRERPARFQRILDMERNAAPQKNGRPRYLPMFGSLEAIAGQEEFPGFDEAMDAEAGCATGSCFV